MGDYELRLPKDCKAKININCNIMQSCILLQSKLKYEKSHAFRRRLCSVFLSAFCIRMFHQYGTRKYTYRPGRKRRLDLAIRWKDLEWVAPVQQGKYPFGLVR